MIFIIFLLTYGLWVGYGYLMLKWEQIIGRLYQIDSKSPQKIIIKVMEAEKTKYKQIHNILSDAGYQAIKSIGRGAFGEVLVAKSNMDGSLYAIKVMSKMLLKSQPYLKKYIAQEINIMKKLNHPNIVRLIDSFETNDFILLIMEYCKEGNLLSYQATISNKAFPINNAVQAIAQILKGLKYIHENGFIHRDIKSENILIKQEELQFDGNYHILYKIADFGFARPIGKVGAKTQCGTEKYMAPQIISKQSYGILVDMWALSVLFYFMLFTQYPFQAHDMKSEITKKCTPFFNVTAVLAKKQKLSSANELVKDFFKKVFVVDPKRRITFSKILSHPLFQSYRNCSDFSNYEQVYLELQKNQKSVKDEILHIPEQFESEAEPQDESRALLLQKIKQSRYQNTSTHLNVYLEELNFEIKKVLYLKQCAMEMYENYSTYLTYAQRLGSKFYLLRAFLFFCDPLLKRLQSRQMPEGFNQINISSEIWKECTETEEYRKMLNKLQDEQLKNQFAYEDTYTLIQSIIHQMPISGFQQGYKLEIKEKDYNEFKFGYRSVTVHLFKVIQKCKNINAHLQNKIKLRIFCCHMIKRIFTRANIHRNFPYYVQWLHANKIKHQHSFDFTSFKRWILQENSYNLEQNIKILHKNL